MPSITEFKVPKNNASGSLLAAINNAVGSLTVGAGEGANFPTTVDGDFWVTVDSEIMLCTSRAVDVLTVTRAQQGTAAAAHDAGAAVELRITAQALIDIHTNIKHGVLEGLADDTSLTPAIGTLPANAFVYAVDIWVQEVFNYGNVNDSITVGYAGLTNAYVVTGLDLHTAVLREHIDEAHANAGATLGIVDATTRAPLIYVTGTGAAPNTGRVYVALHYIVATVQPA